MKTIIFVRKYLGIIDLRPQLNCMHHLFKKKKQNTAKLLARNAFAFIFFYANILPYRVVYLEEIILTLYYLYPYFIVTVYE